MKTLICFGTRPEAIKMAMLCREFKSRQMDFKVCVTAQHREMLDQVLEFFELQPDYDLDLMQPNQSLNNLASRILSAMDTVLNKEKFDLVLVHGDTLTSTLVAQAAFYRECRVGHVEAGLRTYDKKSPFPEELNRQLTGRIADYHFAPTTAAQHNLLEESVDGKTILVTGNTVIDALKWTLQKTEKLRDSPKINELKSLLNPAKKLILVTGHRRENFGKAMGDVCEALVELSVKEDVEILFAMHLNPQVEEKVTSLLGNRKNIHLVSALDYPSFVWAMNKAHLIISDSGGIQEEAPSFNVPVIITRSVTERREGIAKAYAHLAGTNTTKILEIANRLLLIPKGQQKFENPYGDGKASERIADFIQNIDR